MQVSAFNTPSRPAWRWRITSYAGEVVAESPDVFSTISAALTAGRTRLVEMDVADVSETTRTWRAPSFGRRATGH
jgi:hypothetical protein